MKFLHENYSFSATARTVTILGVGSLNLENFLLITNVKTNAIIYNFAVPEQGGTLAGNVLTLKFDTSSMDDADPLQIFIDSDEGVASVVIRSIRRVTWTGDVDFNKGGVPAELEVSGVGDAANLQLSDRPDPAGDFQYNNLANYTPSDAGKITVNEAGNGQARLLASTSGDNDWLYDTPANYTFNGSKVEVTGGVAKLAGSPVALHAWYHLNESSGVIAADSSGNGRDGTTQNMEAGDWVAAKLNNGLQFDGSNEYVNMGSIASFEKTDAFSLECWFNEDASPRGRMLVTKRIGSLGWSVHTRSDGMIAFFMGTDSSNFLQARTTATFAAATWHHVVVTHDGSGTFAGMKIYVNGSLATLTDFSSGTVSTIINGGTAQIAALNGGTNFSGIIDEVVIYDSEVNAAHVTTRYNAGAGTETMPGGFPTDNPGIIADVGYVFSSPLDAFQVIATIPGGTEIRFVVSADDGATWKWWTGSAWATITGVTDNDIFTNESNTAADIDSNISTLASSGTFAPRSFLHSDSGAATPELGNAFVAEGSAFPTDDNLYVDTKDAAQLAPANLVEWLSAIIASTIPGGTDARLMFSNDGRASWLTWSGSAWVAPASSTARTDATPLADAQTNFPALPIGSETLDTRLFLQTTDSAVSPGVDNIAVTGDGGLETAGTWESNQYDSDANSQPWGIVTIAATLPDGTSIDISARAANSLAELSAAAYVAVIDGGIAGISGRYFQFRAVFAGLPGDRPILGNINAEFRSALIQDVSP